LRRTRRRRRWGGRRKRMTCPRWRGERGRGAR